MAFINNLFQFKISAVDNAAMNNTDFQELYQFLLSSICFTHLWWANVTIPMNEPLVVIKKISAVVHTWTLDQKDFYWYPHSII